MYDSVMPFFHTTVCFTIGNEEYSYDTVPEARVRVRSIIESNLHTHATLEATLNAHERKLGDLLGQVEALRIAIDQTSDHMAGINDELDVLLAVEDALAQL